MTSTGERQKKALIVVNCFPPLVKNAGGVSKRYFTLCRALIDGLGWQVTILTPVDVRRSGEADIKRWLDDDQLVHLPARGVRITSTTDGVAVFMDLFSFINTGFLLNELSLGRPGTGGYDCIFMDDVPWRMMLLLLARAWGIPTVVSSHTDVTHMKSYKGVVKLVWALHMWATHLAAVHATVSRIFGNQMAKKYNVPFTGLWPPILWSQDFKEHPSMWAERAKTQRQIWLDKLKEQGCTPKWIFMSAGRWSQEKRIHLLCEAVPKDCALVIVGDGTSEYCDMLQKAGPEAGRPNVLPLRKMLNSVELRTAYAAADLFLSASNFETLGNTVIEAWCSGTPVAVQPAQGHLEFVKDGVNSWFVDFDDQDEARSTMERIAAKGLDVEGIGATLPEFLALGEKLRTGDFAQDFNKGIIEPALEVGAKHRVWGNILAPLELLKRLFAFLLWFILFVLLRTFNRVVYVFSTNPQMEVLGRLGGAIEDKSKKEEKAALAGKTKSGGETPTDNTDNYSAEEMYAHAPVTVRPIRAQRSRSSSPAAE